MVTSRSRTVRQRFRDADGVDKLWMFAITILVLLSLKGCGPLGIQGNDDIARDGRATADKARDAALRAKRAAQQAKNAVERNRLTRAEVRKIAREQAKPSTAQILNLIQRATEVCARNPAACQRITSPPRPGTSGSGEVRPRTTPAGQRSPARSPPRTHRQPPSRPYHPPSSPTPPPGQPGQNDPSVVTIQTPDTGLPKHPVCADNLVRVDCP